MCGTVSKMRQGLRKWILPMYARTHFATVTQQTGWREFRPVDADGLEKLARRRTSRGFLCGRRDGRERTPCNSALEDLHGAGVQETVPI